MMSTEEEVAEMMGCASCGITEGDNIKLKKCNACYLVRYCGVKCQKEHRPEHKKACKKRAAELRDEIILFKQPEGTDLGDCPICCLPLPVDSAYTIMSCCSKNICKGCTLANTMREYQESLEYKCPFCRKPAPTSEAASRANVMKRIEANDPAAMSQMGICCQRKGDYAGAHKYWAKAAELGHAEAHYNLSVMYSEGYGVGVGRGKKKEWYHLEQAAIGGNLKARYTLGIREGWCSNHNSERANKHLIIAANQGHDDSMKKLKEIYASGMVGKDDLAAALRAHQAAVDATKSPQREVAAEARSKLGGNYGFL
ncbi:hypothetical protein QTG54_006702 [Skeletonema marinoi]|uniref:MYND-type domain-containing protein n=1 Tax=Skeletonema marinoi TaxID=267567 RepID=A0AAD9DCA4_9STRA|nr:hypothetical protein QTG54_006702 [Skeletonema marinoi]